MRRVFGLMAVVLIAGCWGNDGGPKERPAFRVLYSVHSEDSVAYITENLYGLVDEDSVAMPGVAVKFFYSAGWRIIQGYDSTSTPYGKINLTWKVAKNQAPGTYTVRACAYPIGADSVCDQAPHVKIVVP